MTCSDVGLCLDNVHCLSNSSLSTQLKDSSDGERKIPAFVLALLGDTERLNGIWVSIFHKCSCKAWTASAAWRPCKSNFHKSLLLFLISRISLAALELSLSALTHSSLAFSENCFADTWSPLRKALVAALECWDADLFNQNNWRLHYKLINRPWYLHEIWTYQ